jgi:hypothetical protein
MELIGAFLKTQNLLRGSTPAQIYFRIFLNQEDPKVVLSRSISASDKMPGMESNLLEMSKKDRTP